MKAEVKWLEELKFVAESGTGHLVVLDTPDSNKGPSPMEMLLMGMGGCTGIDVISILKKARQTVRDCRVQIEAEREDDYPRIFRKIHLHFILSVPILVSTKYNEPFSYPRKRIVQPQSSWDTPVQR